MPWFKFYAADYLLDQKVDELPLEARGLLTGMWAICHLEGGSCPADPGELARKLRLPVQCVSQCFSQCEPFFDRRGDRLFSHRMEAERRRSMAAQVGAQQRWKQKSSADRNANRNAGGSANGNPLRNANRNAQSQSQSSSSEHENRSDQVPPSARTAKAPSAGAWQLAELLKSEILRNKPDYRITQSQLRNWEVTADRMLRLDRRSVERIADVIRWAQHDEFWMVNVLSMDKLREKFDQLEMKAGNGNGKPNSKLQPPRSASEIARLQEEGKEWR